MKILIVTAIIAGIVIYVGNYKKRKKSVIAGLCVLTIIAAVISNGILNISPMPKDTIQLTALGECNPNASNNEVALKNFVVDDVWYEIDNAVEGKWFWEGDLYMWRSEDDSRQPEGVTRSITLEIPKGNSRQLVFSNSMWRGFVEITYNDESSIHDLYNDNWVDESIDVPGNGPVTAYMIKLGRYVLFILIIAALMAYFVFAAVKYDYNVIKGWFGRNWNKLFYAAIAIVYIVILQSVSADGSLWADEVWQMGWYYSGYWPKGQYTAYRLLFTLWTRCMPYGQEYLRLLSQLFVAGTIYFAGLIGSSFKSKRLGVLFSSIIAFSGSIIYQCSLGIRTYAMMLFTTTLMIYLFIKKQNNKDNIKVPEMILYGLVIVLAMDAHTWDIMVAGLLMISDFILILLKKVSKKCWFEFICPAIYGLYWITSSASGVFSGTDWIPEVSISGIWDFIKWVFSYNNILVFLAITGFICIVAKSIHAIAKKHFDFNKDYAGLTIVLIPLVQILFVSVYSLSTGNQMFADRYFVSSFIFMFFILAIGFDYIITIVGNFSNYKGVVGVITTIAICTMSLYSWINISAWNPWTKSGRTWNNRYKQDVDYLMGQNDCYDPSTIFIVDHNDDVNIGIQYYTTHNGERDDIYHCSIWNLPDSIRDYSVVYTSSEWTGGDRANNYLNEILDSEYQLVSSDDGSTIKKYVRKN